MNDRSIWLWTGMWVLTLVVFGFGESYVLADRHHFRLSTVPAYFATAGQVMAALFIALAVALTAGGRELVKTPGARAGAIYTVIFLGLGIVAAVGGTLAKQQALVDTLGIMVGTAVVAAVVGVIASAVYRLL